MVLALHPSLLLLLLLHLKYSDRLKTCKLPTLYYRRTRITRDMIETYKILSGKYDLAAIPNLTTLPTLRTRGNDLRLQKNRARYYLRIFSERELRYVRYMLSPVRLSSVVCLSVCNVGAPYSEGSNFRQFFTIR